jgi:hypothetical protein
VCADHCAGRVALPAGTVAGNYEMARGWHFSSLMAYG